jgi:DNA-binding beta-propeller fold protein YncE
MAAQLFVEPQIPHEVTLEISPTSFPDKLKGNLLIVMLLIFSLAGARFWLEKEAGAIPYPYWLAVSDDAIAVLYGNTIYVSDTKGTIVRTISIPDHILPCQLSWHNNNLLVSDWRNDALHLFSAEGISSIPLRGGPKISAHLNAVIDERHNAIYVTDSGGNRIHTYDSEGRYVSSFGACGSGRGALVSPKDIRFRDNLLYVGNVMRSGVDVFSTDGTFIKSVVEPKGNRFDHLITDFDVEEDRIATIECNVFFEQCRIAVYDGTGMLLNTIPHPDGSESVGDIALRKSIVYVSDTANRKVTRYAVGTLVDLGPVSADLNALGTSYTNRYNALKNASRMTVIALLFCFIPLALLYRQYKRSRKDGLAAIKHRA